MMNFQVRALRKPDGFSDSSIIAAKALSRKNRNPLLLLVKRVQPVSLAIRYVRMPFISELDSDNRNYCTGCEFGLS